MKGFKIISMILLGFCFSAFKSSAYEWRTYTVGDGLKDNLVRTVAVDAQTGKVWFGTKDGASRFDGVHWESYLDKRDVRAILVEETNKIWFGTDQGVFLKEGGRFSQFLSDLFIQDIALDRQGVKWIATRTGIRSTVDGITREDYNQIELNLVETVLSLPKLADELSKYGIKVSELEYVRTSVTSITIDKNDVKKLATNVIFKCEKYTFIVSGVSSFDNINWEFIEPTVGSHQSEKKLIEDDKSVCITTSATFDKQSTLWYSKRGRGAFVFANHKILHHYLSQDINQDGRWFGTQSPITIQDLDGDGQKEVVAVAETGYDLQPRGIYVYDLMSGEKKWPYPVGPHVGPGIAAVGDVTGNGHKEVVLGGTSSHNGSEANGTDDAHGSIFILDSHGKNLWGRGRSEPLTPYGGGIHRIALANLDRDGVLDIIGFININFTYIKDIREDEVNFGGIIITDGFGKQKARVHHDRPILHGGVADLDNDGFAEIVAIDDKGLLMIFDHKLSRLHSQQFEAGTRLVAIADLYGDGGAEILLISIGKFTVLNSQWTKGELATLWKYSFSEQAYAILSDIEPGGATEILIKAKDAIHILSYETLENFSFTSQDTGWRYGNFYSLLKTAVYPHAPSVALEQKPFTLKHLLPLKDVGGMLTADVNRDGQLDIISQKDNAITVWEYNNGNPQLLWKRKYPNEQGDIRLTALEYDVIGSTVILASIFRAGMPELLVIDAKNGAIIKSIEAEAGVTNELRNNFVNAIKVDKTSEDVWFATDKGVSKFDGQNWQAFSTTDGLADRKVNDIAFDTSHNVWFATSAGVSQLDRTIIEKSALKASPTILLCDNDGFIWCGTLGDGIREYKQDREKHYLQTVAEGFYEVTAFAVDLSRNVLWASAWMGGSDQGLYKINIKTAEKELLTFKNSGLISNRVTAMTVDRRDGSLWLGTSPQRGHSPTKDKSDIDNSGINRYNPDSLNWEKWPRMVSDTNRNELPIPESVTSLLLTDDDILWIGTSDEGVRRFDTTISGKKAWTVFTREDGLASNSIRAIVDDDTGRIWFATENGVSRYDEKTNQWQTYTTKDGLAGNFVNDVKTFGNVVWFATNGGISKYDGHNWLNYDTSDGLVSNFVLSIAIDKDGALWMGTHDGKITKKRWEKIPPETFIVASPEKITSNQYVTFEYLGADLGTETSNLLYSTKLTPQKPSIVTSINPAWLDWSDFTPNTKVSYGELEYGTYKFQVRAMDKDVNVDATLASFDFQMTSFPFLTLWQENQMKTKLKVIFSTANIEFQNSNTGSWEFIKPDMALDIADRIRMPPASILKLQWGNEKILITQCQENIISHLIQQTLTNTTPHLQRSYKPEGPDNKKKNVGSHKSTSKSTISKSFTQQLNIEVLNQIAVPDEEMVRYVSELLKKNSYPVNQYPYKNLGIAMFLFDCLRDLMNQKSLPLVDTQPSKVITENKSKNDLDYAVLYLTWLQACEMKAELKKQDNQLFIVFNTEMKAAGKLTANTDLYKIKEQKVWIPVLITLSDPRFVRCWYHGAFAWKSIITNEEGKDGNFETNQKKESEI